MVIEARCTFRIVAWKEDPYDAPEGGTKLSHATVSQAYTGAIEGTGAVEYLMSYAADGTAEFVGLERITGSVEGRSGSFVLRHAGVFEGGKAKSSWTILPGRGTGALSTLRGEGSFVAGHGEPARVEFRYGHDSGPSTG
jgi:hypothetical protein